MTSGAKDVIAPGAFGQVTAHGTFLTWMEDPNPPYSVFHAVFITPHDASQARVAFKQTLESFGMLKSKR